MRMEKFWNNLWKYIFPALSIILWVMTIIFFIRSKGVIDTTNYVTELRVVNAMRWHPVCLIGAIISTAAAYVISEVRRYIDE